MLKQGTEDRELDATLWSRANVDPVLVTRAGQVGVQSAEAVEATMAKIAFVAVTIPGRFGRDPLPLYVLGSPSQ